jgi:hypothetical protein
MRHNMRLALALATACGLLSACASGGGGGGGAISYGAAAVTPPPAAVPAPPATAPATPPAPPPVPFTEWSVVGNSADVILTGSSRETTYETSWITGRSEITSLASPGGFVPGVTLNVTRAPVGGDVSTVRSTTGSVASGYHYLDTRDPRLLFLTTPWDLDVYAWLGNPTALGLNYQSFGAWQDNSVSGNRLGVFTAGVPSNVAAMPTTGTASYRGYATGTYLDTYAHAVTATATATADFAKASIALSLTDTVFPWDAHGAPLARPDLDLSGTLTSATGANAFAGPVVTKGGVPGNAPMGGTADALFYGPGAAEVGGVFWVTGAGVESYGGAFGGKQ